ncbi:hypothetical protein [Methylobacterium nodulans]|uniref:hypothetical protein n=1 Tax=Methylobacterium nodulans TaxID=114616 RepID=UPI0002F053F4|nr:hypothetical protein [Methylobacterium nodulans]
MLNIIRIIAAGAVLVVWSHVVPALSAIESSVEQTTSEAPSTEKSCPLRAWPYIG